jgi:hypothetical protein
MNNTRDVLREALIRLNKAEVTGELPSFNDLIATLETPCSSKSSASTSSSATDSQPLPTSPSGDTNATDPLAAARALMAGRGVWVFRWLTLYFLKAGHLYCDANGGLVESMDDAKSFLSEPAAILAWLEAEWNHMKQQWKDVPSPNGAEERHTWKEVKEEFARMDCLIAAIRPLVDNSIAAKFDRLRAIASKDFEIADLKRRQAEAGQPAAKPQPACYSVDDERILVQWRDADGYDHSITIDADEAVYRIDADGIHEFIREWPLPKQPADDGTEPADETAQKIRILRAYIDELTRTWGVPKSRRKKMQGCLRKIEMRIFALEAPKE